MDTDGRPLLPALSQVLARDLGDGGAAAGQRDGLTFGAGSGRPRGLGLDDLAERLLARCAVCRAGVQDEDIGDGPAVLIAAGDIMLW